MPERDPLSERFDPAVRRALLAAIRARPASHAVWVASPGPEFRSLDRGGRTSHERAFTRAAYYAVFRVPLNQGLVPDWSLRLTWGPIERRGSRYGRTVQLRMFTRRSGERHNARHPGQSWVQNEALRSQVGARY